MAGVLRLALWAIAYLAAPSVKWQTDDVLDFVNPLIGTENLGMLSSAPLSRTALTLIIGHVFGGSSLPYAMVKPVADAYDNNRGGFAIDGNMVTGYSHMHDTGTGGVSEIGCGRPVLLDKPSHIHVT